MATTAHAQQAQASGPGPYIELLWPATGRSVVLTVEDYCALPAEAVARSVARFCEPQEALEWFGGSEVGQADLALLGLMGEHTEAA